ncbi:MAG: 1-acyl-sn-glycerol-3-phosphate acyltransferase [Firmicutes bacterium]|nr:1-acyl-sn-glycerol-3-phosphate acyltransferase [Bacillota bacterium]
MKPKPGQTIVYRDELTDDFFETRTNRTVSVDGNYRYLPKNPFFRFFSFLAYYCLALPLLWLYGKLILRVRVEGRKNVRKLKKTGYVVYCNHTNWWDSFIGAVFVARPKRTYVVANKTAISIRGIRTLVRMLGCIPVPDTTRAFMNFNGAVKRLMKEKKALVVFPEAHIWPYYTGIRPFSAVSFQYAVAGGVPALPVAVTYRAPKKGGKRAKKPRPTIHIGEPVYPDLTVGKKCAAEKLRERVYDFMVTKAASPDNYAFCRYVKRDAG